MARRQENSNSDWNHGLGSNICGGDCGTCLGSWFCGCFVFGRTAALSKQFPDTDKSQMSVFDANCATFFFTGLIGFHWIPMMLKRKDFREQHHIDGNGCTDCLVSICCTPCGLAQMQTEVKDRAQTAQVLMREDQY